MKFEDALMAVRGGAAAYCIHGEVAYWLVWNSEAMYAMIQWGKDSQSMPSVDGIRADWTVIGAKVGAVATAPVADDFQYVSENVWDKVKEWDELASHLNGLGVPDADGVDNWTLRERVEWYVKAVRKYDASGVAPSIPHLSDIEHPMQGAYPDEPPIPWRIIEVIASERAYQDQKWGTVQARPREVAAWMTLMRNKLENAEDALCSGATDAHALEELRKAVALGVACFAQHGVPKRGAVAGWSYPSETGKSL